MYGTLVRINRNSICCCNTHRIICRHQYTAAKNHYEVLNLSRNCTNQEIRHAFAKLSKQYHPDTCKSGSVEQNTKKFQEIMEAYRILSKKDSRTSYDASGYSSSRSSNSQTHNASRQYDYHDYDYQRNRRRSYQNPYQNYENQYNNNRQYYYDWSTHRIYRPYEKHGKQGSAQQNGFYGLQITDRQILSILWGFILFSSIIHFVLLTYRRAHMQNMIRMQEVEKYATRSYRGPDDNKVPDTDLK